jgi:hypothetical protein
LYFFDTDAQHNCYRTNPVFFNIIIREIETQYLGYTTCSMPTKKKSGFSVCTHQSTCIFCLVITSYVLFFKVLLQWSEEVEVTRWKVQAVWWVGKTFPVKQLQDLYCGMVCMRVGIIVEKNHFLCEQARAFQLDGFLMALQCFEVVICTYCCPLSRKSKRLSYMFQNAIKNTFLHAQTSLVASSLAMKCGHITSSRYHMHHQWNGNWSHPQEKEFQDLALCRKDVDGILECKEHSQVPGTWCNTECILLLHNTVAPERCHLDEMPWFALILLHDNAYLQTAHTTMQLLDQASCYNYYITSVSIILLLLWYGQGRANGRCVGCVAPGPPMSVAPFYCDLCILL